MREGSLGRGARKPVGEGSLGRGARNPVREGSLGRGARKPVGEGSLGRGTRKPVGEGSLGRGARARILTAARELFTRQGINATRINELNAAARVSKRTLYQHFDSKEDLVLAYLAENSPAGATEAVLAREDLAPRTRLLEIFTALAADERTVPDPLMAALVEFPDGAHAVHQAAAGHALRFRERLTALAREAGAGDPERTARRLVTLYNGACCRLLGEDVTAVVADVYLMAASVLREAIDY